MDRASDLAKPDENLESSLRPSYLKEFLGQEPVHEKLTLIMNAAKQRNEPLGHCIFHGPPGLGKTTLSSIIANSMNSDIVTTSGPVIEKAGDLAGLLTNLKKGDILFIDEIHRINKNVEEYLYPAMENFELDLIIDSGPSARSVKVNLNPFTLIGATTRIGLISSPLRSRFSFCCRLDYYDLSSLKEIVKRSAKILNVSITNEGASEIAIRSRGTPRIANNLLKWTRDYAQIHANNTIDKSSATKALEILNVDAAGLDEVDKKILSVIIEHHDGGPVGLNTLAIAIGEEPSTISEVYEPYLILQGFLKRTPRGREVTKRAYEHLKITS